ncbi:uncharacterized protein N7500_005742 [Penicillium coprophilum]|uniref:uncharacterized protein n=1 Tax=Penicillium coprophilum TaxID=36646 RepID=UPI0023887887|nr:uncharacterized protein N7500_005742 [Penicillium coprophilum]KAJ5163912.1 hypothetical protein N7500_005742 [Penicillium coprophilum]
MASSNESKELKINEPMPGDHGFFTPIQSPPAGSLLSMYDKSQPIPRIFEPITIRSTTFQNRIWVSPMCQYSCPKTGELTDWHLVQLGSYASRGASLTIVEATGVSPEGRNTMEDAGLWTASQVPSYRRVANFIHSQGQKAGIQLQHCGRKASVTAPWLGHQPSKKEENGFPDDLISPSDLPYKDDGIWPTPTAMTKEMIQKSIGDFVNSAKLAVEAGFDVIEIHGAHGYLIHQFCSPLTNKRTDEYGGSFENRVRFALELVQGIRAAIPENTLLFYRISATDWIPDRESWTPEQSVRLCQLLQPLGVDLIDVSSGGLVPDQQLPQVRPAYQAHLAQEIKDGVPGLLTGSVGMIRDGKTAEDVVASGKADVVIIAREFARNPSLVLNIAYELGVRVKWPIQLHRSQPRYHDPDL